MLCARLELKSGDFQLRAQFELPAQGIIGMFGPSGSGKTTLLRCMAGLQRAQGVMRVGATVWQDDQQNIYQTVPHRDIGFVFQEPRLFPHLTVRANLEYGWRRTLPAKRRVQWEHAVRVLDLEPLLARRTPGLSMGEQQRVAIARAALASPCLLFMDEPLAALDGKRKQEILPFIRRVATEFQIPIVYVSHALPELLQLADALVLMERGELIAAGPLQHMLTRLDLREHFHESAGALLEARVVEHEAQFGLTRLDFNGQVLYVPQREVAPGTSVRVHVLARNVTLSRERIAQPMSVLNVLQGTVTEIADELSSAASVAVKLDVGAPLLVSITRKSLAALELRVGQRAYAYIKAVALADR